MVLRMSNSLCMFSWITIVLMSKVSVILMSKFWKALKSFQASVGTDLTVSSGEDKNAFGREGK